MFQSVLRKLTVFNNEQLLNNAVSTNQVRLKYVSKILRKRNPVWFIRKELKRPDEHVTRENRDFVKEVVEDKLGKLDEHGRELITSKYLSPLKGEMLQQTQWTPKSKRCGLIARKIGVYPMWTKTGRKYFTTLLQVLDNQVIKHFKAGEYKPLTKRPTLIRNPHDVMLIGAEGTDPTRLTKEYCGLFKEAGVMPKAVLLRFFCTPECVMPVGTTLNAMHFRVGDYVDIRGKTISRGFQGVMKRWGFKGMPATHGVTKTHRRPGNIGGGGEKGRVWPGKKLPGHMGNRYRISKALKILRINPKFNVIWVKGQTIAGETNNICVLYDSIVRPRRPVNPHCPTFIADNNPTIDMENDIYDEEMYKFSDPTITFKVETKKKK